MNLSKRVFVLYKPSSIGHTIDASLEDLTKSISSLYLSSIPFFSINSLAGCETWCPIYPTTVSSSDKVANAIPTWFA